MKGTYRVTGYFVLLAVGACHYAGPLAGGGSQIREGTLPDRVARFLAEGGGAQPVESLLPSGSLDSAALFLVVVDQRAIGLANAKVAVLPHSMDTPDFPKEGWRPVDSHGVYVRRFVPGEYMVYVKDQFHWAARKILRLRVASVDTVLVVMRSSVDDRTFQPFPE